MRAWIVDAFADAEHMGNAAAVIERQDGFLPTERMQSVACGLGLPTTAFIVPDRPARYRIRWFTPREELDICGHATIASACYLYDVAGVASSARLCFCTHSGALYTARRSERISIDLPRMAMTPCEPPAGLQRALGARIVHCARAVDDIVVEVESEAVVAGLRPGFHALARIPCRGHIVTARGDSAGSDFVSRSFFPSLGVDEDQVCVSAHCKLGPYWAQKLGKRELSAVQLSAGGGRLLVGVTRSRVRVLGSASVRGCVQVS
jgi:PhzF family phenazine biosynthesis protein